MNRESKTNLSTFQPSTLADSLGARLRADLSDGGFVPGETVSIRRIAEREGVSVIPARDALRGLVGAGALQFRDSRTIVVPEIDAGTLSELRCARIAVEGELSRRAASKIDEEGLRALSGLDEEVNEAVRSGDVAAYMRANRAFHFTLYEAANAPLLTELAETLWLRVGPSMGIVCHALAGVLPEQDNHAAAIAALAMRDAAALGAAIEADITQGLDMIEHHLSHTVQSQGGPQ